MRLPLVLAVLALALPAHAETLRVASFNASMNRAAPGELSQELTSGSSDQAAAIAEILQRVRPDIVLINEFDVDESGETAHAFRDLFLAAPQNGQTPITDYAHIYVAPSNTGLLTGVDLSGDGIIATEAETGTPEYASDSHGFGFFPGQFGFVLYSRLPMDEARVRSFQTFLWQDMPGNLLTEDPTDAPLSSFYSDEAIATLRLSSKNHVDVPVRLENGELLHLLLAHPTPPVFDGPEDRNGKRNHDEIRLWADYISNEAYLTDGSGASGGLPEGSRFVILGDYNADPFDGDSFDGAIRQLIDHPLVMASDNDPALTPGSDGGSAAAERQGGDNAGHTGSPRFDTADFGFNRDDPDNDNPPGNLRVDYALPSAAGLRITDGGVFWLTEDDPAWPLGEFPHSDHRLVWIDLEVVPVE